MGSKLSSSNREDFERRAVSNNLPLSFQRRCLLKRKNLRVLALSQTYHLKAIHKNWKANLIQLRDVSQQICKDSPSLPKQQRKIIPGYNPSNTTTKVSQIFWLILFLMLLFLLLLLLLLLFNKTLCCIYSMKSPCLLSSQTSTEALFGLTAGNQGIKRFEILI